MRVGLAGGGEEEVAGAAATGDAAAGGIAEEELKEGREEGEDDGRFCTEDVERNDVGNAVLKDLFPDAVLDAVEEDRVGKPDEELDC